MFAQELGVEEKSNEGGKRFIADSILIQIYRHNVYFLLFKVFLQQIPVCVYGSI